MIRTTVVLFAGVWFLVQGMYGRTEAWSPIQKPQIDLSRRIMIKQTVASSLIAWTIQPQNVNAASNIDGLVEEFLEILL